MCISGIIDNEGRSACPICKQKIKFIDDPKYIGEIMTISCEIFREDIGYIHSNKCQIEITS